MKLVLDRHTANLPALIFVVVIGFGGVMAQNYYQEQARIERVKEFRAAREARNAEPLDDWMEVRSISVPDHNMDEDAFVILDRTIKKTFTATWSSSVEDITGDSNFFCISSGEVDLDPEYRLPDKGVSLRNSVLRNMKCPWKPGQYRLKIAWTFHRDGYDDKTLRRVSNVFSVLPVGAQPFITGKQVEQLEQADKLLKNPVPPLKQLVPAE